MELFRCSKGHLYDSAQGRCPICATEENNMQGNDFGDSNQNVDDIPPTDPAGWNKGNFNDPGATEPVTDPGFTPTEFVYGGGGFVVEDYDPTIPVPFNDNSGFDPVVGWLICVKGPNRGRDYRLHNGRNTVGRDRGMDVCIEHDQTISRRNAAFISYDDYSKTFFITQGDTRNLIYVNDRPVRSDSDVVIYDRIRIGNTELIFVPLCGNEFNWQDN